MAQTNTVLSSTELIYAYEQRSAAYILPSFPRAPFLAGSVCKIGSPQNAECLTNWKISFFFMDLTKHYWLGNWTGESSLLITIYFKLNHKS